MPTERAGFGVEVGQLQQVARQYDAEGADLMRAADSVPTNVGEGQVGRGFEAVAAPYRQAFEQFGRNLVRFGEQAVEISARLNGLVASYVETEDANQRATRGVY